MPGGSEMAQFNNRKTNKYGNRKVLLDGYSFDSVKEANRYKELMMLQKCGEINGLKLQPVYVLQDGFDYKGKRIRAIKYIGDFEYIESKTGEKVLEDTKGFKTKDYLLKAKMLKNRYPEIDFREL